MGTQSEFSKQLNSFSQDFYEINDRFETLKLHELSCMALGLFGIACSSVLYDITYEDNLETISSSTSFIFAMNTSSTIFLLLVIVLRTHAELEFEKSKGIYPEHFTILHTKTRGLCIELLVNLIHPVWFLPYTYEHYITAYKETIHYPYNAILSLIVYIRLYHVLRTASIHSKYCSLSAYRICKMNGSQPSLMFFLKSIMQEKPLTMVIILIFSGIIIGAYMLRITEREVSSFFMPFDYNLYENTAWLSIVSMTTVGYGDVYPISLPGKIIGIFLCLWGIFSVAITVLNTKVIYELNEQEQNALSIMDRLKFKEKLRKAAAMLIEAVYRVYSAFKHKNYDYMNRIQLLGNFKYYKIRFKNMRLKQKAMYNWFSIEDNILKWTNYISENNKNTIMNLDKWIQYLEELNEKKTNDVST